MSALSNMLLLFNDKSVNDIFLGFPLKFELKMNSSDFDLTIKSDEIILELSIYPENLILSN